jgi:protein-L-isoaspartate(D-aspartate) O-methyltransferase
MEEELTAERQRMVAEQMVRRGIHDPRVLEAMRSVPRHRFVLPEHLNLAYSDGPLPIGQGQTISQPYIVALMTELLSLSGNESILEVGTGSGYQAAVLACLAHTVYTIERHAGLSRRAQQILQELGASNVQVEVGDGSVGLPAFSPYDGIIVTAAAPAVPPALLDQLAEGGRLVIPVGGRGGQMLECWQRGGQSFTCLPSIPVAFVPLLGEAGWHE